MMDKYISLGGHSWGPDCTMIHSSTMEKVAGQCHTPESLLKVMDGLRERPEGVYVLLNALGAYEYWGDNRNSDAFPEWSLKSEAPPKEVLQYLPRIIQRIPNFAVPASDRYGTCTFVTDAHVFVLHANKDPLRSTGDVIASAYNEHMHRSELIVFIYDARDPAATAAVRRGEPVPFSMGAKLPFDVCSICFNIARSRQEYCDHLKNSLGKVFPDGRKVFAYNWFPRFFDISRVRVPADRSAWSLKKVACLGPEDEGLVIRPPSRLVAPGTELTKVASILGGTKTGAMVKQTLTDESRSMGSSPIDPELLRFLRDQVGRDSCESSGVMDPQMTEALKKNGLKGVLGALSIAGIVLKPSELTQAKQISGEDLPKSLDTANVPTRLITIVRVHRPGRSLVDPSFSERRREKLASYGTDPVRPEAFGADYQAYLDLLKAELVGIVKEASSARVRTTLDPEWAGITLFKTSGDLSDEDWMPFITAITQDGSREPVSHVDESGVTA